MTIQQKTSEAEEALKEWGIEYNKRSDGMLIVKADIDISHKNMTKLPNLTSVVVKGNFLCNNNQLTSLAGAPASVGGNFWCYCNQLTSLEGASAFVGRDFSCSINQLTSLEGAPASIGRDFWCYGNQLTSLKGAPTSVGRSFWCHDNHLISLAGAPTGVRGDFWCYNNRLTSLEGAPLEFDKLSSDLGKFASWNEVPEHLRTSPETKEKVRLEMRHKIGEASVQRQPFKPSPSIRFKAGPK